MIIIVDNGNGAEKISSFIRAKNKIVNFKDAKKEKGTAYILSDGIADKKNQEACLEIIEKAEVPVLGIGLGAAYIGAFFGGEVKETKAGTDKMTVKKPCPLLLDFKKSSPFTRSGKYVVAGIPEEDMEVIAVSKAGSEVFMANEAPYFGVCFNPEAGGDGRKILNNFEKFITEVWEKYHK